MTDTPPPYRWKGILPQKSSHSDAVNYSNKVFLGGLPLDANEQMLADTFSQFGPITWVVLIDVDILIEWIFFVKTG